MAVGKKKFDPLPLGEPLEMGSLMGESDFEWVDSKFGMKEKKRG